MRTAPPISPINPIDAAMNPIDAQPDAGIDVARIYEQKGCITCHSTDGTIRIGPSLKGSWGSTVTLADGAQIVVDDAYVRESILDPLAKMRVGFSGVMPSFRGVLADAEVDALVAYIRSMR